MKSCSRVPTPTIDVGLRGDGVGGGRAGDADRAEVERVVPGHRGLAGLGLADRDVVLLGEGLERAGRLGVEHAAAGDDQRPLRAADGVGGDLDLAQAGARAAAVPFLRREELGRPVVGLGLHVLAEGEGHRAALGGVGHRREGAGQRGEQLLGPHDAVEVAADRPEGVVDGHGAVVEVLELLQHRVGRAVGEDVAGEEQHRQAVDVGERAGGHEVERARADRGGDRHRPLAVQRLGVGDGGVRHALLVVAAPGREVVAGRRGAPRRCRRRCRGRRSPSSRRGRARPPRCAGRRR